MTTYKNIAITSIAGRYHVTGKEFNTNGYASLSAAKCAISKNTITIYRIENKDGEGMYRTTQGKNITDYYGSGVSSTRHPCPQEDKKLRKALLENGLLGQWENLVGTSKYSSGFMSVEQLRKWLSNVKWLKFLSDNGFVLAVADVLPSDVLAGDRQCMFIKPKSYRKENITKFFNLS